MVRIVPLLILCSLSVAGCNVGPPYHRASVPAAPAYKEAQGADGTGWKLAQPGDSSVRRDWWKDFNDPTLNGLEDQINISNQTIAAAMASFLQARAIVKQARSQYFPTLTTDPSVTRARQPANAAVTTGTSTTPTTTAASSSNARTYTEFSLPFDASWAPDLWGRVRNTVKADVASAQSSAADLEITRLTAHAEVAVDYFELRAQDAMQQLLDATVSAYQAADDYNHAQYDTGIASDETVAQADVQLQTARAQATNLGIARAQYEHAIALLVGQPASSFTIAPAVIDVVAPATPVGLPSQLLERRPDVASTERLMAQANAQIGVARAAYFPTLTLSGAAGFESSTFSDWLNWPDRFWSLGANAAETLFDAGLRHATVLQYRAAYDQAVANYRQSVLTAFQQVEDNLAALRILATELQQQQVAVASAQRYVDIATTRYQLGIDPYLNVVTAQTSLLANRQTAVSLRLQQLTASVQLIEALGGGWDAHQLPGPHDVNTGAPDHTEATP